MAQLTNVNLDDYDQWTADVVLPGERSVQVVLDADDDADLKWADVERVMQWGVDRLTESALIGAQESVVSELIDVAFEMAEEPPSPDVYAAVGDDVTLAQVVVSPDMLLSLLFRSPKLHPDKSIVCELDDDLEVSAIEIR